MRNHRINCSLNVFYLNNRAKKIEVKLDSFHRTKPKKFLFEKISQN